MIREQVPALAREVLKGRVELVEPLGELLLLPLATHVGVLVVVLAVPFAPTQIYAAASLGLVAAHTLAALAVGGGTREDLRALAEVPLYVLQKIARLPATLLASRKDQAWVRTQRAAEVVESEARATA
jgi:hypothetical protein